MTVNTLLAYHYSVKIVRTAIFEKSLKKLGATASDISKLMTTILANPEAGDVISGLGGMRKVRFAMAGRGKRGGGRAIYFVVWVQDTTYLMVAYSNAAKDDLSEEDKAVLRRARMEIYS